MLPIFKWTGGKRKELKVFSEFYPKFIETNDYQYIEPFFGGGAVYWSLNNSNSIISDIDTELINFLNVIKSDNAIILSMIEEMKSNIEEISLKEKNGMISISEAKELRGEYYYKWRNKDRNNGLLNLSNIDRAFRFLFINQMAFNGMRRFNSKGEFNVPYGNYKSFNPIITEEHIDRLQNTTILNSSYEFSIKDEKNTFIYIDPPYTREFKEYSHDNVFGKQEQLELFEHFKNIKHSSVMIIINKDDFTCNLYKDYIKSEYDLKYSTNIKNRFDNNVKHLIITNY